MSWRSLAMVLGVGMLIVVAGVALAYNPSLDVIAEYDDHDETIADVAIAEQFDIVFSLDKAGGFYAYQIQGESVSQITEFDAGHALTVGEEQIYIAAADTLWAFDAQAGELNEVTRLQAHPPAIAYDATRDVVWTVGNGTVYGYHVSNGSEYMTYTEHTDGIQDIAIRGDYIATGTTWTDEAIVYDVAAGKVVLEPSLPDDVGQVGAVHVTDEDELVVGTGAENGDVVAMFDIDTGERLAQYREHAFSVSEVEYLADHEVIVSMGFDNTIKFYDVTAGEVAAVYEHPDTIYAGDLDTRNDAIWFGDGEERTGTVTGIDVFYQEPTPTPTPTETPTATAMPSPTPEPTVEPTPTPTVNGQDGAGFGAGLAVAALAIVALLARRR